MPKGKDDRSWLRRSSDSSSGEESSEPEAAPRAGQGQGRPPRGAALTRQRSGRGAPRLNHPRPSGRRPAGKGPPTIPPPSGARPRRGLPSFRPRGARPPVPPAVIHQLRATQAEIQRLMRSLAAAQAEIRELETLLDSKVADSVGLKRKLATAKKSAAELQTKLAKQTRLTKQQKAKTDSLKTRIEGLRRASLKAAKPPRWQKAYHNVTIVTTGAMYLFALLLLYKLFEAYREADSSFVTEAFRTESREAWFESWGEAITSLLAKAGQLGIGFQKFAADITTKVSLIVLLACLYLQETSEIAKAISDKPRILSVHERMRKRAAWKHTLYRIFYEGRIFSRAAKLIFITCFVEAMLAVGNAPNFADSLELAETDALTCPASPFSPFTEQDSQAFCALESLLTNLMQPFLECKEAALISVGLAGIQVVALPLLEKILCCQHRFRPKTHGKSWQRVLPLYNVENIA